MRDARLILCMSASLDGFLARPDHTLDWFLGHEGPQDARRQRATVELVAQMGTIILGRGAYDEMSQAWPGSTSAIGTLMNTLPKVVFSSTLADPQWANTRVERAPVEAGVPELLRQSERDVVCFGGARFAHALARHRLIDEYRLTIHPVALGEGLPLWHGLPEPHRMEMAASAVYSDGSVTQTLVP